MESSMQLSDNTTADRLAIAYVPAGKYLASGGQRRDDQPGFPQDCVVCGVLAGKGDTPVRSFITKEELPSEMLESTARFAVVADVAPLAPGHLLLVTKSHTLAMSKLSKSDALALEAMHERIARKLRSIYQLRIITFEHGAIGTGTADSCSIDHAHLHMLPTKTDIEKRFRADFDSFELARISDIGNAASEQEEYLLLIASPGDALIAYPRRPASQYFRKLLAELTSRELWNWQDEIMLSQAAQHKDWILQLHRYWSATASFTSLTS
jgi:diadenosine tetraphosphate (Ap4A) HIT family hydrolase